MISRQFRKELKRELKRIKESKKRISEALVKSELNRLLFFLARAKDMANGRRYSEVKTRLFNCKKIARMAGVGLSDPIMLAIRDAEKKSMEQQKEPLVQAIEKAEDLVSSAVSQAE